MARLQQTGDEQIDAGESGADDEERQRNAEIEEHVSFPHSQMQKLPFDAVSFAKSANRI
jgi:hypothetical protein